jgi:DNA-binding CsgD family transcriptional regulator
VGCRALLARFRLAYADDEWSALPEVWQALSARGQMLLCVVENRAQTAIAQIVSFSITVFATDEFCSEARLVLGPFLGAQIVRRCCGQNVPILDRKQIAHANAGSGLNVVLCFAARKDDGLSDEQILAVREKQTEAFFLCHRGYRLKEFLADAIGEAALERKLDSGARLRREYSCYFRSQGIQSPDASLRPRLVGLTKEEARANPGSLLSSLFVHTPPKFRFSDSEQLLLQHAMMGETTEELAASLFVSLSTVKKRWRAIYERVADIDSQLLGNPAADGPNRKSRGAEHRRHLLYYLRQHPEELRPFSPRNM